MQISYLILVYNLQTKESLEDHNCLAGNYDEQACQNEPNLGGGGTCCQGQRTIEEVHCGTNGLVNV